jgi:methylmalonyl-CoA mutase N-terminal domain/subunit
MVLRIDPEIERRQIERCPRRSGAPRAERLSLLGTGAVSGAVDAAPNLVPPSSARRSTRATVGEISDTLRLAFGEHREIDV